jgi:hypothetical protein
VRFSLGGKGDHRSYHGCLVRGSSQHCHSRYTVGGAYESFDRRERVLRLVPRFAQVWQVMHNDTAEAVFRCLGLQRLAQFIPVWQFLNFHGVTEHEACFTSDNSFESLL